MSRKDYFLVGIVVVLAGVYLVFFTNWFRPKVMRIEHTTRSMREAWTGGGRRVEPAPRMANSVTFALHASYRLTSVKVVIAAEGRTNASAHALWHLVSPQGSTPVNTMIYGLPASGMAAVNAGQEAEPLEPGVEYRLLVEAGLVKGVYDFQLTPKGQ